jgi:light-regulated signal transduction histidine kinase (bacteriophytochrome)
VASHDLKEPLRKIRTYGSRIVDEFGDTLPERARIFLQKMENAAARMSGMIDGVLGYSMLNATEQVTEVVELDEILSTIQSDLELLFERKGAAIHCGQLPVIEGSTILIYQLFYNLIGNAMKFSREDQAPVVNISAQLKTGKEISASLVADATYVQVKVTDNGIGFHPSQAEMIFKTFTRLHARDHYEGTGLGLSLCQKIVERHHGLIHAEGHPNEGATFTVILPVRQAISVKG